MNKGVLLAILSTILVAGCVGAQLPLPWIQAPTAFLGGNGLVITEFVSDNTEVYNNKSAKITMTVANKGGATVPDGSALAVLQGSAIQEGFAGGDLYWTERGTTTSVYQTMGKDMDPYDPVRDVPADEKILNWYLTSPVGIDPGTLREDIFIGRLYYDYSTTVTGNVWVYSETEADAAQAAGRGLNQNSFSSTSGPVALYVSVKPTNVIVDGDNTFTMQIKVSNVGGGTAYCQGCVDYVTPDLEILAETELNILSVTVDDVPGWSGEDACSDSSVELVKGEATLTCDVTVTDIPTTFRSDQVKVTANYGYWVERTASITVSGK